MSISFCGSLGLLLSFSTFTSFFVGSAQAQTFGNLAGQWQSVLFSVPAELGLTRNTAGDVIAVPGCDRFEIQAGPVIINPDGSFNAGVEEPVTGQGTWSGQGLLTITVPGEAPILFHVNAAQNLLLAVKNSEGYQDFDLLLKAPASLAPAELYNTTWNMLALETPAALVPVYQTNGHLLELQGREDFSTMTGSMTINGAGVMSGNMGGPFTGTFSYAGEGVVNVTINPSEGGSFLLPFYINASKDLMVGLMRETSTNDNFQQVIFLVRAPAAAAPADLQGLWKVATFSTPHALQLSKDNQNRVLEIVGRSDFETGTDTVVAGHDGFFVVNGTEPGTGTFSLGSAGNVTVTVTNLDGTTQAYGFKLNAARDTMIAVHSSDSEHELVALTKAPPVTDTRQNFGLFGSPRSGDLTLFWASAPDRELQSSTNLLNWESVPGTAGQHSFTASSSAPGLRFYRVRSSAP